jgi:hypothetical protein
MVAKAFGAFVFPVFTSPRSLRSVGDKDSMPTVSTSFRPAFRCSNVRVVLYPRQKDVIEIQEKVYILNLVFLHHLPGSRDSGHAV